MSHTTTAPARPAAVVSPGGQWLREQYTADVSVIIVNYNSRAMLERTLRTLFESGQQCRMEVIVVDNGSRDGSVELVREQFPQVRLVANAHNVGLTRANNQGMEMAGGRYLCLLNNDVIIYADAIDALVRYLDDNPHVGAAGSKVLNIDGSIQGTVKAHPTPMAALFGRHSPLTKLFPKNPLSRRYLVYLDEHFDQPFAAGSVSSCAIVVRREAVQRAGPIDERYFVYWSDVDWCRAFWEAGCEVHCVPQSVITHDEHKGGTRPGKKRNWATIKDFHRGAYIYFRKWHVRQSWHPGNLVAIVGLGARACLVMAVEHMRWALVRRGQAR